MEAIVSFAKCGKEAFITYLPVHSLEQRIHPQRSGVPSRFNVPECPEFGHLAALQSKDNYRVGVLNFRDGPLKLQLSGDDDLEIRVVHCDVVGILTLALGRKWFYIKFVSTLHNHGLFKAINVLLTHVNIKCA